jgi:hypothetical protein
MKKFLLVLFLVLLYTDMAHAFDADFFRDYKQTELKIEYNATRYLEEVDIYITDVDDTNYLLVGMTNSGKVWIPIGSICKVTQLPNRQFAVYNRYQY